MPRHWAMSPLRRHLCHDAVVTRTIDYTALIAPTTREQVRAFRAEAKASGLTWVAKAGPIVAVQVIVVVLFGTIFIFVGGSFLLFVTSALMENASSPVALAFTGFLLLFIAVTVFAIVAAVRGSFGGARWERWMRLSRFAAANGMTFSPQDKNPNYPGLIFARGESRVALDHLTSATGRFFDVGNYRWVTRSGDDTTTHNRGFLAFNLDRKLPHMILDATANNGLFGVSNLGVPFSKDQVLSLEGDFDRHFTLYCPRQYERDALYIFTPDLMALLIDEAAPFDVEIVDDWMFVYSDKTFTPAEPAVYQRLFRILDTIGAKTLSQTERYADERIGDRSINLIAPQGQRLKRSTPVLAVFGVVVFIGFVAWTFVGSLFDF